MLLVFAPDNKVLSNPRESCFRALLSSCFYGELIWESSSGVFNQEIKVWHLLTFSCYVQDQDFSPAEIQQELLLSIVFSRNRQFRDQKNLHTLPDHLFSSVQSRQWIIWNETENSSHFPEQLKCSFKHVTDILPLPLTSRIHKVSLPWYLLGTGA